jgi:hypothetical protein
MCIWEATADEVIRPAGGLHSAELTDGRKAAACGRCRRHEPLALGRFVARHARVSKQLILDLTGVDFFGSQGFTALYYVSVQCARRDVDWMIAGGRTVLRILRICDPDEDLPLAGDIAAAYARLDHITKTRHAIAWGDA